MCCERRDVMGLSAVECVLKNFCHSCESRNLYARLQLPGFTRGWMGKEPRRNHRDFGAATQFFKGTPGLPGGQP